MKKIISLSSILTILFSQAGCVEDNSQEQVKSISFSDVSEKIQQNMAKQLFQAVIDGDIAQVQKLCKAGVPVNMSMADTGFSPLMLAVINSYFSIIKLLVEQGADVNSPSNRGTTPLMIAVGQGEIQIAEYLIQHGADINHVNETNDNALTYTLEVFEGSQKEIIPLIKLLLQHNINIEIKEHEANFTPLMIACQKGYLEVVKLLVEQGANVNAPTGTKEIDISNASAQEQIEYLENVGSANALALANEIKKTGKTISYIGVTLSETPLSVAATDEIRDYLIKHGAKE